MRRTFETAYKLKSRLEVACLVVPGKRRDAELPDACQHGRGGEFRLHVLQRSRFQQ